MYLLPEQRAIGKDNFCAIIGNKQIRRELLKKTAQTGVTEGNGLGELYFGYGDSLAEPLRVGIIGTGDEAGVLIGSINPKFISVKSIADIRPYSIWRAFHGDHYTDNPRLKRPGLLKAFDWKSEDEARRNIKVYGAFEELIAGAKQDGVEAVIIVLPLHLHARAAVLAMKAGLHVFCEKLMAHSVCECKEMGRAAKQTGLVLSIGYQRHYNILYDNAVELIRRRLLGDIHYIRAQWARRNMPQFDLWKPTMPRAAKPDDPQADVLDNTLRQWLQTLDQLKKANDKTAATWEKKIEQIRAQMRDAEVDAKKFGYQDMHLTDAESKPIFDRPAIEELIRWRLWYRTGAGLMAELGSHQFDAANMYIAAAHEGRKQIPLNVCAAGSHMLFPADREVDDHVSCIVEFPAPGYDADDPSASKKKIGMQFSSINGTNFEKYGESVFGTEGTMLVEAEEEVLLYRTYETGKKIKLAEGKDAANNPRPILQLDEAGDVESAAIGALGTLPANRGYIEELEHWAWCARNRDPANTPRSTAETALGDAAIVHVTNMAVRQGSRIEFKKEWFDIASDETPEGVKPDINRYDN